jgi:hypothetical protein
LINQPLKWFEDRRIEVLRVAIAEGNESALSFYRRFGYAERMILMQKTA